MMGNRYLSKKVPIVFADQETLLNKRTILAFKCNQLKEILVSVQFLSYCNRSLTHNHSAQIFRQIPKIATDIYCDVASVTKFYAFHLQKVYFSITLGKV